MRDLFRLLGFLFLGLNVNAQDKKTMDITTYDIWNSISNVQISNNGDWVSYEVNPDKGDGTLHIYNTRSQKSHTFKRGSNAKIDAKNNFVCFNISPHYDSIQYYKRQRVSDKKMPKDSLGFFDLQILKLIKIPQVQNFKIPKEGSGVLAYQLYPKNDASDTLDVKKESKENGSSVIVRNFKSRTEDTLQYISDYYWNDQGDLLAAKSTGKDSTEENHLFIYEPTTTKSRKIWEAKGTLEQIAFSQNGNMVSFLTDEDTTEVEERPFELQLWKRGESKAKAIANDASSFLPNDWHISNKKKPSFSKESRYITFGVAPTPLKIDTSLLEEEIINVEVWSYTDQLLHTEQNVDINKNNDSYFLSSYDTKTGKFVNLSDERFTETRLSNQESEYAIVYDDKTYKKTFSWEGILYKDVYLINLQTGKRTLVCKKQEGNFRLSPKGKFVYWYNSIDSTWMSFNTKTNKTKNIAGNETSAFYDETNDRPMHPWSNGSSLWLGEDDFVLIYDRYDIWKIDPNGKKKPEKITDGRKDKTSYRVLTLDNDIKTYPVDTSLMLMVFDEKNKYSGYGKLTKMSLYSELEPLQPYQFSRKIYKAKASTDIVFTKESFELFPNLIHSDLSLKNQHSFSDANPQQKDYAWGSAELVAWTSKDGTPHQGMLFKPEGFDANEQYPMIVNFYEKGSNGLYRHRAPFPHRSTINYSYYINQGYVIFNPDVHYKVGYPGESCFNSVMSGMDKVIEGGFIDEERIGVQGHSWGGYQIAHLITKTDRFKCAESGAPVVNMFSAYGGIRWRSGLSRMFQYEHTQSRIGGTIWDSKQLYEENSPIFNLDKVNTPVLILHNDKDGAVPWYQGIEFFVGMRRLGKPAWMLNYNGEPHWPLKRQNRIDFNKRMAQFFAHYLKDEPMPKWMKNGIPAKEKGINQAYEFDK